MYNAHRWNHTTHCNVHSAPLKPHNTLQCTQCTTKNHTKHTAIYTTHWSQAKLFLFFTGKEQTNTAAPQTVQIKKKLYEYLEHLTRTGPKHLHIFYKYILPKINAYNINEHTHTHTPVAYQGNETEEKVFKKRKVFKENCKELTAVEWRTKTGSWFQITGAW